MRPPSVFAVLLVLASSSAHADRGEWRLSIGGGGAVLRARAAEASGVGVGLAGQVHLALDLDNSIDLGLHATFAHATDVRFAAARLEGQMGTLFADVTAVGLLVDVRWTPGVGVVRCLERTAPYLAARAGVELVGLDAQQLLSAGNKTLVAPGDLWRAAPVAGGAFGVAHRFGDRVTLAAEFALVAGIDAQHASVSMELGWISY